MISDYRGCILYILRQMPPSAISHGKERKHPMGSSSFLWDFQKLMKDWWRAKNVAESLVYSGALYFPSRFLSPSFWGRSCPDLKILFCLFICFVSPSTLLDNFLFSEFGFSPPKKKASPFVVQIFIFIYYFFTLRVLDRHFPWICKKFSVFLVCIFIWNFLPNHNWALLSSCVR